MNNITLIVLNTSPIILNATLNQPPQDWQGWLKDWLPLIIFIAAPLLTYLTWSLNERAKRSEERYLKEEEEYLRLIELIEALKENEKPGDPELSNAFMHQINRCWMYCPDNIFQNIVKLISNSNNDEVSPDNRDKSMSDLMITMRKQINKKTKLDSKAYMEVKPAMLRKFVLKAGTGKFKVTLGDLKLTSTGKVITQPGEAKEEKPGEEEIKKKGWWQFWR